MKRAGGFTMMELMIAIAVISGLALITMGPLRDMVRGGRVKNTADTLFTSLLYARGEAVKRNTCVDVVAVDSSDWSKGWKVQVPTASGAPACGGADTPTVLRTYSAVEQTTIAGPTTAVNFNGSGRLKTLGDTSNAALCNNSCSSSCTVNNAPPSFRVQLSDTAVLRCVSVRSSGGPEVRKG